MSNSETTKPNIAGLVAIVLFVGLVIYIAIVTGISERTEQDLNSEKLRSELLLSEKLSEQKLNVSLHEDLDKRAAQNKIIANDLQATRALLAQKEAEIRLARSGSDKKLIREQKAALVSLSRRVQTDSLSHAEESEQLRSRLSALESRIADKNIENQQFIDEIERLRLLSIHNIGVESHRKNQKLTARASRTKKISATLDVSSQAKALSYKIIDPMGKELATNDSNSSLTIVNTNDNKTTKAFFVSPELQLKSTEGRMTVVITYNPSEKLLAGVYKIMLFSGHEIISSLMLRLE